MKFSSYSRAVQPNIANPPAVQAIRDPNAYGTQGKEWDALGGAVGQVNKVLTQKQDDEDALDVLDARNKIMTSLTEQLYGEQGLLTTGKGENAKGLTERTTKAIRDTYNDVARHYNPRVRYALQGNLNENMSNFQRIAASQEKNEKEEYDKQNVSSNLDNIVTNGATNYRNNDIIKSGLDDGYRTLGAYGLTQGVSGITIAQQRRGFADKYVGAVVGRAMTIEDYDRANEILSTYKGDMSAEGYNQLAANVYKHKQIKDESVYLDDLIKKNTNKDGVTDWNATRKALNDQYGPNATKFVADDAPEGFAYSGNPNMDAMINEAAKKYQLDPLLLGSLIGAESGYDSGAVSPAGAIGLGQLMPDTAQRLGVDPYDDKQNLDGSAKYLRQLLDEFGGDATKAVAAYNAGPEAVEKYGGVPPYSETQNYVQKVLGNRDDFKKQADAGAGQGFDYMQQGTYYDVNPGAESEVTGLNANTWQKLQIFSYLWQKEFGEKPLVTSGYATTGHSPGGGHPDGRAVDIVAGSMDDEQNWAKAEEIARKAGLEPYNEYDRNNWTEHTTGNNFHLRDTGSAADASAAGSARKGHKVSNYQPEKLDRLMKLLEARYADQERERTQAKNALMDQLGKEIMNAGGRAAALQVLEGADKDALGYDGYARMQSFLNQQWPAPRPVNGGAGGRSGRSGGGGGGYSSQQSKLDNTIALWNEKQAMGESISAEQQLRFNNAATAYYGGDPNAGEDNLTSTDALNLAAHAIDVTNSDEEAEWYLIQNGGFSETEARYYVKLAKG